MPKVWMDIVVGDFCFVKREMRFEYMRAFGDAMLMVRDHFHAACSHVI